MSTLHHRAPRWRTAVRAAPLLLLSACGSVDRPAAPAAPATIQGARTTPAPDAAVQSPAPGPAAEARKVSNATTPLAYRRDAASHLYAKNADRIYKGVLQPMLYAIGVLDVEIDRAGQVTAISWRRAPNHAPEVMTEIVRTVRNAAPYPVPARMGRVTYTDVWLWDKSGKFQLDTLTEGQL